jgi:hypothetical protein
LKARFDAAAGHSNRLLTMQGARDASWGLIADHFSEIDRDHDGYVNFDDISAFMAARSPLKKKSKAATVHVIQ